MVRNQESHSACTQMANDEESPFETGKILIRDLAPTTTRYDLNRYFMQYADVTRAIIPQNCVTGNPHSFGFVVFAHPFQIPLILQLPHCIHDRRVEVSRALKGEDLQILESQRMTTTGDIVERLGVFDKRNIFAQGSPRSGITNDEFLKYFQGFGNVINCYFWDDIGHGYILFRIKRSTDRVMYRRSYILNGKRLKVYRLHCIPRDHNDARNPNVSRAINIQEEAPASSGGDHVNGTRDMRPQAAASVSNSRNMQILPDAASSGTDHVNSTSDMRPQAAASVSDTREAQIAPAAASSGTNHVNGIRDMQSPAAASVSDTRNMQIVPAAASSGGDHVNSTTDLQPQAAKSDSNTRDMQIIPAAASCDTRYMHIIPAAASSHTGHPWNNSPCNHRWRNGSNVGHVSALGGPNLPPHHQRMPHYRPQINYMVPGVPEFRFPGPNLYQPYIRGMGIYTNAANNFPGAGVASFPRNYTGFGNFPILQIVPAAASSGGDHVNSTTDTQPQAAECDSNTRDMQIIPAAASCDTRNTHIISAAASSRTGHPWNNSPCNHRWRNGSNVGHVSALGGPNLPPRHQRMPHYRPQINYMVPGVLEFRFPGHRPNLYQPYIRGMGIYTNAANNFPGAGFASFPRNYAGFGNFPIPPTGYSNHEDYFYYDNTYQYD